MKEERNGCALLPRRFASMCGRASCIRNPRSSHIPLWRYSFWCTDPWRAGVRSSAILASSRAFSPASYAGGLQRERVVRACVPRCVPCATPRTVTVAGIWYLEGRRGRSAGLWPLRTPTKGSSGWRGSRERGFQTGAGGGAARAVCRTVLCLLWSPP
ncbi:hypothetical protein B0H11DRAFT_2032510 [Mycena galericulata]|nr:hypothetical protein B0H11DRAFT_2032510 [Mycena galericulata]